MEETEQVADKSYDEKYDQACIQFMLDKQANLSDPSSSTFYVREKATPPLMFKHVDEPLRRLETLRLVKVGIYNRPWTGPDPRIRQVEILPAGMELIRAKVTERTVTTTTTTERITEPIPDEEDSYQYREKKREFTRTERGFGIMHSALDDFLFSMKSKIMKLRRGDLPRRDFKALQIWLDKALEFRGSEVPPDLKAEAQDCVNLPLPGKRRNH
jgi:hypothetical protein